MDVPQPIPVVHTDLLCRRCGYNLRTLSHDKACPECGTSVEWSVKGWQLRYANPAWVRTLRRGSEALFWVSVLSMVILIGGLLSLFPPSGTPIELFQCAGAFLLALLAFSNLMLTTPEPASKDPPARLSARWVARFPGTASLLLALATIVPTTSPGGIRQQASPALLCTLSIVVALFFLLLHACELARRMPDHPALVQIRHFAIGLLCTFAGLASMLAATMYFGVEGAGCVFLCSLPFVIIIFMVWFMMVASELNAAIGYAANASRASAGGAR